VWDWCCILQGGCVNGAQKKKNPKWDRGSPREAHQGSSMWRRNRSLSCRLKPPLARSNFKEEIHGSSSEDGAKSSNPNPSFPSLSSEVDLGRRVFYQKCGEKVITLEYSVVVIGDGAPSTLPWIKRTSGKKELGAASCAPTISHVGRATRTVVGLVLVATPVPGLSTPFCRVI
jgi:hypothetical protein